MIKVLHVLDFVHIFHRLRLDERWGATPSAIDTCLRVAEYHDISVSRTFS